MPQQSARLKREIMLTRDENKRLKPTDIAGIVIDLLIAHFPSLLI